MAVIPYLIMTSVPGISPETTDHGNHAGLPDLPPGKKTALPEPEIAAERSE